MFLVAPPKWITDPLSKGPDYSEKCSREKETETEKKRDRNKETEREREIISVQEPITICLTLDWAPLQGTPESRRRQVGANKSPLR